MRKRAEWAIGRILACITESHHDHHIHHCRYTSQRWCQYLTFVHWGTLLPPPRCTRWFCRWFWRFRTGLRNCEFCLWALLLLSVYLNKGCSSSFRWGYWELGNNCWGDCEPNQEYATSRQIRILAVCLLVFLSESVSYSAAHRILSFYVLSILLIGLNGMFVSLYVSYYGIDDLR